MRTAHSSSCRGEGGSGPDPPEFPPWLWAWIWSPWISPLGVGLDLIPLNFPLGCGPGSDPPEFPPWVWAWIWSFWISPLGVGLDLIPLNFPLGCGLGPDPPQFPPWVWVWRGVSLAGGSPGGAPWQGGLPGGSPWWGVSLVGGLPGRGVSWGVSLVGGLASRGVSLAGGSPWQGGPPSRGVSLAGGLPPWQGGSPWQRGVSLAGGLPPWQGGLPGRPPPVNRITDACENITLPQTSFAGSNNKEFLGHTLIKYYPLVQRHTVHATLTSYILKGRSSGAIWRLKLSIKHHPANKKKHPS